MMAKEVVGVEQQRVASALLQPPLTTATQTTSMMLTMIANIHPNTMDWCCRSIYGVHGSASRNFWVPVARQRCGPMPWLVEMAELVSVRARLDKRMSSSQHRSATWMQKGAIVMQVLLLAY
jgi:hypothetical protein